MPNINDPDDFEYVKDVLVAMPDDDADDTTRSRLKNLGYDTQPITLMPGYGDPVTVFQTEYKPQFADIAVDGTLNDPTKRATRTSHNAAEAVMREGSNVKMVR